MKPYDHKEIEAKWQKEWFGSDIYHAKDSGSKKFYGLIEFPFPSGDGLHTGHMRSNTAMDIICRKRRMEGFNVLYPIGWDAFGLPTENYAVKTGIHPKIVTKNNTDRFREQLQAGGFSFDWSREVNTSDPDYYKWTQWIFLKLFEKGLAYKNTQPINWCPSCKIGLANEEAVGGVCERCGGPTEVREKDQWMLAITKYADRLDKDLDDVDYLEKIKIQQRNWIGKSEGTEIDFKLTTGDAIPVFTTRPDTIFGDTYVVLAPEHALVEKLLGQVVNADEVRAYVEMAAKKDEITRTDAGKEKTGVELKGIKAINPANSEEIPVYVADYVLANYGTGAIMAVPADDARDEEFATKFNLPIVKDYQKAGFEDFGKKITRFKLRDWVFSRQRYWGEPIPMVWCAKCNEWVPVPEDQLPVVLLELADFKPTDDGQSPLAKATDWIKTTCPKCGGKAKRETDTMPNWAGSSWYFLRYIDPKNNQEFASMDKLKYWTPVDWYNGGMEHTTLHLLYSRFWHKFLFDIGVVPTSEPYQKRTSHGLILAEGGVKMSKSKGNVVNPDEIIKLYGADTLRVYEMFMGPFDQSVAWSTESIIGSRRFVERVWRLQQKVNVKGTPLDSDSQGVPLTLVLNQTIKKVSDDIEAMGFNTAISSLMILVNEMEKQESISKEDYEILLKLVAPFAPHFTEELWHELNPSLGGGQGGVGSIHSSTWPIADESKLVSDTAKITVQVNSKVRAVLEIARDLAEKEVLTQALTDESVKKWVGDKAINRVVFVPNKLVNILIP